MASVIWDPKALEQVHGIYDYYYEHMSPEVAADLLNDIMIAPNVLETAPQTGASEPIFENEEVEFRYLVVRKHWKLIYFILGESCHIAVVWDTRNNPALLPITIHGI